MLKDLYANRLEKMKKCNTITDKLIILDELEEDVELLFQGRYNNSEEFTNEIMDICNDIATEMNATVYSDYNVCELENTPYVIEEDLHLYRKINFHYLTNGIESDEYKVLIKRGNKSLKDTKEYVGYLLDGVKYDNDISEIIKYVKSTINREAYLEKKSNEMDWGNYQIDNNL